MPVGETTEQFAKFEEPTEGRSAGTMVVQRPPSPYERYVAAQGIPVYEAPGIRDVRDLELAPWQRVGGNGAFVVLDNTVDLVGIHVLEIPPGGALEPARHLYEERYWVVEGEGTTELWQVGGDGRRQRFEWHAGSLFAIPVNVNFRLVNAGPSRVLLIVGNTAPPVLNIFDNERFVFANDFPFSERYDGQPDYFTPSLELLADPVLARAMWRTSVIPDIVGCELPLDNQRSPGYRRVEPHLAGGNFYTFIGEHQAGRYAKAHAHSAGAVLICVKGKGYTYNWPIGAGTTPWKDGKADLVERVDYTSGGMVAAAPGGGDWYHQHFPTGRQGLRMLVFIGGLPGSQYAEYVGRTRRRTWFNADIEDGGSAISYRSEDPHVRAEYQRALAEEGVEFRMPPEAYR